MLDGVGRPFWAAHPLSRSGIARRRLFQDETISMLGILKGEPPKKGDPPRYAWNFKR